ncbi:hypothetical protein PTTG_27912 [Puccinia triticina 1-1 BBBD Race 1]|uniref:U1 small nuclear ribonucleoprotein C n=2 Tax=Puccinia triticina TaxID=208348 RepID=A0A180GGC3_PUCT1|nr:uncharacterized protein PtA15_5A923 [Puccinia triticina]OAV91671.1 hypothetical protein PTTG_27912 [Puccinia triticina 1-1 BBBD Race 1]WAQ85348.1 hypothetical protein PtA15_5A923 [Puccinia triticina]WAR58637.1 hypothetical protein PtB15_5B872 [Puccinia triticina]
MGKYYCDYCDVFLVSESPSVRKAHNSGRNHLTNVRDYYSSLGHDKAQSYIDEITRMFETGGGNSTSNRGPGGNPLGPHPVPPNPVMGGQMRPPMHFPGPPMMNNTLPGMPPPHVNGYSSGPLPPQHQQASGGQPPRH